MVGGRDIEQAPYIDFQNGDMQVGKLLVSDAEVWLPYSAFLIQVEIQAGVRIGYSYGQFEELIK